MMRAFFAVLWCEVLERRLALVAAALLGMLPLIAPTLPGVATHHPDSVRQSALLLVVALLGIFSPFALGASLFSQDLVQRRLGFFFARPIPSHVLWFGKLIAALLVFAIGLVFVLAPSLWADPELFQIAFAQPGEALPIGPLLGYPEVVAVTIPGQFANADLPRFGFFFALAMLVFIVITATHAFSTLLRVRSAWLLLDVFLLSLVVGLVLIVRDLFLRHQAYGPLGHYEGGFLVLCAATLAIAGWCQLHLGRAEPARSRGFLAAVMWPGLLATALIGWGYAWWAVHPSWSDVTSFSAVKMAPDGRYAAIMAPVDRRGGHSATFLSDLESGERTLLGSFAAFDTVRFSADGGRLFWLACRRLMPLDCEIKIQDLRARTAPRSTGILIDSRPLPTIAISPMGDLLAVARRDRVSIWATANGQLLAALNQRPLQDVRFLDSRHLLLALGTEGQTRLKIWDLETRRTRPVATLRGDWFSRRQLLDRDHRRLLYSALFPRVHELRDLETGELIIDLFPLTEPFGLLAQPLFLEDSRVLLPLVPAGSVKTEASFDVTFLQLDPAKPDAESRLGEALVMKEVLDFRVGPEVEPGRILIARRDRQPPPVHAGLQKLGIEPLEEWSTWLLEIPKLGEPSLRPLTGGLMPSGTENLFWAGEDALVRWDVRAELSGEASKHDLELMLTVP